ncbi:hypothetical protein ID852_19870 [Xenorhabdus sp. 42]|uniref:Tox-REase-5 domain-containing protein n=1 Tax=Xenorhabdus szentirmaii TaxID=290112 RepID=UPI000C04508F|nr:MULTISPECIES: Tox-REase-5 domain-containing protein [Xenorhabdus]MBD2794187.1 hypothetical protein [Xenorhabdus sp. CUL]MBD2806784.1 hypothetical protein [Xenorhabdus sp. ZM]MBD2822879.1 hypothetical protein [Xenorhabdus sp. 42]PHM42758.1 hypothetical protein Xszus_02504 [Xenorhabdus szentirmaii]
MPFIFAPAVPALVAAAEWTAVACVGVLATVGIMENTKDTTADDIDLKPKKPKIRTEEEMENDIKLGKEKAKSRLEEITKSGTLTRSMEKCKSCPASSGMSKIEHRNFGNIINLQYQVYITQATSGPGWVVEWEYLTVSFDGFQKEFCLLQETKGAYDQFFIDENTVQKFYSGIKGTVQQAHVQDNIVCLTPPNKLAWYFMEPLSFKYFYKIFRQLQYTMDICHKPMV